MENFIVSARKYRPGTFNSVVGQRSITSTLKNAIKNDHLAQAFLFCGPRGVGKTTCARILAKTINCKQPKADMEPCNECTSCVSFNENASFNIHELDAASNNSVDDIRNLIDQVRIPPQDGKYKVYIIDEVHMLSQAAFNAFLKTLEEPPAYAKFILATTEKHKILPTILSRCQVYDFKRITISDIAGHLNYVAGQEGVQADKDGIHIIAEKADGALRDALSIFDQIVSFAGSSFTYDDVITNLNVLDYDYYFRLTDHILKQNVSQTLLLVNEILNSGFDGHHFVNGFGNHLRSLLVSKDPATVNLLEVGDSIKEKYKAQAQSCDMVFLVRALDLNNQCDVNYKTVNNKRLHIEIAIMQTCTLGQTHQSLGKQPGLPQAKTDNQPQPAQVQAEQKVENKVKPLAPQVVPEVKRTTTVTTNKRINVHGTGFSLKKKLNKTATEDEQSEQKIMPEVNTLSEAQAFTKEEFIEIWKQMCLEVDISNNLRSTLINSRIKIDTTNFNIVVPILNPIQETSIQESKQEMLNFLRSKLGNKSIQFETVVNAGSVNVKPYGPEEKFKKLFEKNPEVKNFKDSLGLDLEL
ncbi:MAG: DNA polymerase III subunit gamma/tau [Bacteroidales bacterium]|nr:DNA polymerase III subunit gamma/tau [Bacteroidales bacterium]